MESGLQENASAQRAFVDLDRWMERYQQADPEAPAALVAALDSSQLGGAALDVVTTEPLPKDSPLLGRDNVILTPHTAYYSIEALEELQSKCASDVARVLSGEQAIYPISA